MEKSAPDLAIVQRRMKDIVGVLENFAARREDGKDRGDYMQQASSGGGRRTARVGERGEVRPCNVRKWTPDSAWTCACKSRRSWEVGARAGGVTCGRRLGGEGRGMARTGLGYN